MKRIKRGVAHSVRRSSAASGVESIAASLASVFTDMRTRAVAMAIGLAALFAGGGAVGIVADSLVSPPPLAAMHPCEEDECEKGKNCVDNSGEGTWCDMVGSGCKTKACGHVN